MKERIRSDKTVVLVSHNLNVIRELCDRALWLENGRVVDMGEPDAVLKDYQAFDKIIMQLSKERGVNPVQIRQSLRDQNPLDVINDVVRLKDD